MIADMATFLVLSGMACIAPFVAVQSFQRRVRSGRPVHWPNSPLMFRLGGWLLALFFLAGAIAFGVGIATNLV